MELRTPALDEFVLAAGALLLLLAFASFRHTKRFLARFLTATGTLASYTTEIDPDSGRPWYYSVIRFADAAGVTREVNGSRGLQKPPKLGTRVQITYDPTYPANAWITGSASPGVLPWFILVLGLAALIGGIGIRAFGS